MNELQALEKKVLEAEAECIKRMAFIKGVKELHLKLTKLFESVTSDSKPNGLAALPKKFEHDDAKVVWKARHTRMDVQGALRKHLSKQYFTPTRKIVDTIWKDQDLPNKPDSKEILYRRLSVIMSTIKRDGKLKHSKKLGWKLA
jgi:hypothetical protein